MLEMYKLLYNIDVDRDSKLACTEDAAQLFNVSSPKHSKCELDTQMRSHVGILHFFHNLRFQRSLFSLRLKG
jgi:hypothetical protein